MIFDFKMLQLKSKSLSLHQNADKSNRRKPVIFSRTIYPSGAPILPDLLRYQVLAVLQYSITPDALYLRQTRHLQNLGITVKSATILKSHEKLINLKIPDCDLGKIIDASLKIRWTRDIFNRLIVAEATAFG